ncbi:PH domain-containing protein [Tenuibacillus multivorans]|uniref:Putative membrane protein n=1 Tax=Tenuibacillus multivorans TaxID=237069 RepID=A0A1H0BTM0_9BACI|nr:PH domain-containing protein [Tenuibacillus multivorans]GEL77039.1 hypothetical protein TMU01_12740 [Tenuibacillus multivorans]SDN48978.1 putative membrane protein [Tenuibacillus multivorans]
MVITNKHAAFLIDLVQVGESESQVQSESIEQTASDEENGSDRVIHFTPTKKDLWKASFTSLSFLAIIPIIAGLYDIFGPLLPDIEQYEGVFYQILNHAWLIAGFIIAGVIVAVVTGVVQTFVRYGQYKISSSDTHIYIEKGLLDESYFAIEKNKVQGIEIRQSFLKRILGLAEVKLVSSAKPSSSGDSTQVNSLYPFLQLGQAFQLIEELLPSYTFNHYMDRLPRESLWIKLLKPSWLWIIATIALYYFKPSPFHIDMAWWVWSLFLLVLVMLNRILDYVHTKYVISDDHVQWWHGGLTSRLFITKRQNVIEVSLSQSLLQKLFKLTSLHTKNRSTPVHVEGVDDVPVSFAHTFHQWYKDRQKDIKVE